MGAGQKLLLITGNGASLCAWRKQAFRMDKQYGVNCSIFRREDGEVASVLLREAMAHAWRRFPDERLFTFVDPLKVNPTWRAGRPTWGHCFYQAGWRFCGLTAKRLHLLECHPEWVA